MRMPFTTMLAVLAVVASAAAQEKPDAPAGSPVSATEVKRADPVVITATKLETQASEIPASVTVVTEDEIRTHLYPSVDEALRRVPGLDVKRSGSMGKTTAVSIRGANANQVQILVDGVRVKSPTLGQGELADISIDLIDRIEVIRGPQSTLYGADAIGGVVHIITKRGQGPFSAAVSQEVGNRDTLRTVVSASGSIKILDYAFSGSHTESNGQFKNDGMEQRSANLRLGLTLPGNTHIAGIVRWNRTDSDLPVKFVCCGPLPINPLIDVNAQQQSETLITTLEGRTRPVDWWESRARFSRYENAQGFQDAADPGYDFDFPLFSQIDVERRETEWVNAFHVGKWSTSTVGLEYRHEEGENKGVFKARNHVYAGFFEQTFRLFDQLFLTGGVRIEDHSVFGTKTTERGGLAWVIKQTGTRLHGSAGSGFRAPTLNDLFFPGFSNPDLRPESSFSWDVGIEQKLWKDRIRLGATFFHNRFTDLIRFIQTTTFPFVAVVNVASARTEGVEVTGEVDILPGLVASVAYTYTDSEDLTTDRLLAREPKHRWNIGLVWEPIRRLSLFTQVHVVSRQFESEVVGFNRGYTRVDIGGTFRAVDKYGWLQALDLTLRVQNLLDEGYAEVRGFPALGTQVLVGARARF